MGRENWTQGVAKSVASWERKDKRCLEADFEISIILESQKEWKHF